MEDKTNFDADTLVSAAKAHGFDAAAVTDVSQTEAVPPDAHDHARRLITDPKQILSDAGSILVCALAYQPYEMRQGEAQIDAYYIAGNRAYTMAKTLADDLNKAGIRAILTDKLRTKPIAVRAGLGKMGRNALVSVGKWGTRVSLQVIVTNVAVPSDVCSERDLDGRCAHCSICVDACPSKALKGDGTLDVVRCVRAQNESLPLPEEMRSLVGNSILGCDLCQRFCPRNKSIVTQSQPEALTDSLRLEKLLSGEYKALKPIIGANYARRLRILNRAALAAANSGRSDLIGMLCRLTDEPSPVREHAAWAVDQLERSGSPDK